MANGNNSRAFFDHVDELPHHYYMHLMHGAQIAGYKHPNDLFRRRWLDFYLDVATTFICIPRQRSRWTDAWVTGHEKHWDELMLTPAERPDVEKTNEGQS